LEFRYYAGIFFLIVLSISIIAGGGGTPTTPVDELPEPDPIQETATPTPFPEKHDHYLETGEYYGADSK